MLSRSSCLQVRSEFSLKTHAKLDTMVKGINQIIPLAQGTMTGLAIRYVMNVAFTAEAGDRPKVVKHKLLVLVHSFTTFLSFHVFILDSASDCVHTAIHL